MSPQERVRRKMSDIVVKVCRTKHPYLATILVLANPAICEGFSFRFSAWLGLGLRRYGGGTRYGKFPDLDPGTRIEDLLNLVPAQDEPCMWSQELANAY